MPDFVFVIVPVKSRVGEGFMYIVQTAETKFFDPVLSKFRTIGIWILQLYQIKENFLYQIARWIFQQYQILEINFASGK